MFYLINISVLNYSELLYHISDQFATDNCSNSVQAALGDFREIKRDVAILWQLRDLRVITKCTW